MASIMFHTLRLSGRLEKTPHLVSPPQTADWLVGCGSEPVRPVGCREKLHTQFSCSCFQVLCCSFYSSWSRSFQKCHPPSSRCSSDVPWSARLPGSSSSRRTNVGPTMVPRLRLLLPVRSPSPSSLPLLTDGSKCDMSDMFTLTHQQRHNGQENTSLMDK